MLCLLTGRMHPPLAVFNNRVAVVDRLFTNPAVKQVLYFQGYIMDAVFIQ